MILNISHDITEAKKQKNNLNLDSLSLSQVTDAVFAFDNNFKITYWNKGAEKCLVTLKKRHWVPTQ